MSKVQMNKSQRRAIIRIIRQYRASNRYTGCTSVRVALQATDYGVIWATVTTRRSDCDTYSARQVLCAQRAFIQIGKRGAIVVHSADSGPRDEKKHVAFMVRGTVAPQRKITPAPKGAAMGSCGARH